MSTNINDTATTGKIAGARKQAHKMFPETGGQKALGRGMGADLAEAVAHELAIK